MKNNFFIALLCLIFILGFVSLRAQSPQSFRYQAVIRNASGTVLQTQSVSLKISLLQSSATGAVVYSEEHAATTNSFGLVNLEIGSGTNQTGTIASIDWAQGPYYIKIEMDAIGGSIYTEMGTTQLLSVPYALFAASGTPGPQGIQGETGSAGQNGQDGQDGQPGTDGIGITSSYVFNDSLYLVLSNAQVLNAGHVTGVQGVQGVQGLQGLQGVQGEQGLPGINGTNGTNGINGADGISVSNTYVNNDSLYITLSDNTTINAGHVRGAQGIQGVQGNTGAEGISLTNSYVNNDSLYITLSDNTTINAGHVRGAQGIAGTYTSGNGIDISSDIITNTAPDQTVNITGNGATIVSGAYPDFTISSTDANTEYQPGTGLTLTGTTFNSMWTTNTNSIFNNNSGNVGIGTSNPLSMLHVQGSIRINDDTEADGFVLTSDANGNATWQTPSMSSASGTANYIPKFISSTALDNSLLYQNGARIGIGTITPSGRVQIQADASAHDTVPIFEIKDKFNKTVMVVYNDSIHFFIKDPGGSKAENKGAFAVSGKNSTKNITNNYFYMNPLNNLMGQDAGKKLSSPVNYTGAYNTFIGMESGYNDTSGYENCFIGYRSGFANTSGYENLFIGDSAGVRNTTGYFNILLGNKSGNYNTTGYSNVFAGTKSGYNNTTGYRNIFIGDNAGYTNTTADYNVFLGYYAGYFSNAANNVFLGYECGYNNLSGTNNAFMGYLAGRSNTSGGSNVFLGNRAGYSNSAGGNNVFLGYYAGYTNDASYNVFLGYDCGRYNSSGTNNAFMGYQAGRDNSTGINNVFVGNRSGYTNTTGNYNVFLGYYAGYTNNADNNVFLGYESGRNNNTGTNNAFMGFKAGRSNTSGVSNVFIGDSSGYVNTTASYNVFLGKNAGYSSNADYNSFMGYQAGKSNNTGHHNTFLGYMSGHGNTGGDQNIFIGGETGFSNANSNYNIFIGNRSGYSNTSGTYNVFMGYGTGFDNTSGISNIFIGQQAGAANTTGNNNVFIGTWAGAAWSSTASNNVYIGNYSGYSSEGSNNVFIGNYAGEFETGSDKLYIANSSSNPPLIYGDFSDSQIGLGTITPTARLHINATGASEDGLRVQIASSTKLLVDNSGGVSIGANTTPPANGLYVNGNVGIGTSSPATKLDVNGTFRISSGTTFTKIMAGTAALGTNASGGVKTFTVNYGATFASTPKVVVTIRCENFTDVFAIVTRNIGTSSFQVNVYRVDSSGGMWGQNLQIDWIAWE